MLLNVADMRSTGNSELWQRNYQKKPWGTARRRSIAFCIALLLGLDQPTQKCGKTATDLKNRDLTTQRTDPYQSIRQGDAASLVTVYNNRGLAYDERVTTTVQSQTTPNRSKLTQTPSRTDNRCVAYRDNGDAGSAISDCDRAIKPCPTYADAYNDRGLAYPIEATLIARSPIMTKRSSSIRMLSPTTTAA